MNAIAAILFVGGCVMFGLGCRPSQVVTFCKGIGEKYSTEKNNIYCKFADVMSASLKKKDNNYVIDEKKDDLKTKKANGYIIDDNYIAALVNSQQQLQKDIPGIMGLRWGGVAVAFIGWCFWVFQPKKT